MLVVIPFCPADAEGAIELLNWIIQLGGCPAHQCLLVADCALGWGLCLDAVKLSNTAFRSAELITNEGPVNDWIKGANSLFSAAARHIYQKNQSPFLWCEPDNIPLKPGWVDDIEVAYRQGGQPFMGAVIRHDSAGLPNPYLEGNAVYPGDAWQRMQGLFRDDVAWNLACTSCILPNAFNSPLFHHFWGPAKGGAPTFWDFKSPDSPVNVFTLGNISPGAVMFHRSKDGTLIRLLRRKLYPASQPSNIYLHGGDVGDLVYGLCAMKAIGAGELIIHPHGVRESFSPEKAERIIPFLSLQPYLKMVRYSEQPPKGGAQVWDFNPFRQWNWDKRNGKVESLCQSHHRIFKLQESGITQPWLRVDEPNSVAPVVIHRSPRYHNVRFPWRDIAQKYRKDAVFVGMPEEHAAWVNEFGPMPHYPTKDYLELARVIAGAKLFIGNQSCPYAIAEGLKQNAILESFPPAPDCQFARPNLQNNPNPVYIGLPDL